MKLALATLRTFALPVLIGAAFTCTNAGATTVVNFDGIANAYLTNGANEVIPVPSPVNPEGTNDYIYGYSATSSLSPNNYTGPTFYGGLWMTSDTGGLTGYTTTRMRRSYTNPTTQVTHQTQLEYAMNTHAGIVASGASFTAFLGRDFVGAAPGTAFSLDTSSSISVTISTGSQSTVRFALLADGQWYLREAVVTPTSGLGGTLSLSGQNLLNSAWSLWDPNGGPNGRLADLSTDFSVLGSSFSNIEGVGYYTAYNASASNQYAYMSQFSANLAPVAVPEPSTVALGLIGAAGIGLAAYRRRSRKA
jgi:hypothetical protein